MPVMQSPPALAGEQNNFSSRLGFSSVTNFVADFARGVFYLCPATEQALKGASTFPAFIKVLDGWSVLLLTWLEGSVEEALALQGPAPDGSLKIVSTGSRQDSA